MTQLRDDDAPLAIWTIGHSTRSFDALVAVLEAYSIEVVVDVRRHPGSLRLPQFSSDALRDTLATHDIAYHWIPALGGRRRTHAGSPNTGWRNASFRGYADHVASEEFAEGLFELSMLAGGARVAVMCAEVLWWRCHRRLLADVLLSLGAEVVHIADATHSSPHRLTPPARVVRGRLTYAA